VADEPYVQTFALHMAIFFFERRLLPAAAAAGGESGRVKGQALTCGTHL
jgi:hypothetical protein